MARLPFEDDYEAVDLDLGQVRAHASGLAVTAAVRERLSDLWGSDWRTKLTDFPTEVSDVAAALVVGVPDRRHHGRALAERKIRRGRPAPDGGDPASCAPI